MKRIAAAVICLLMASIWVPNSAFALFIDVLSSEYHVTAWGQGHLPDSTNSLNYSETSDSSLNFDSGQVLVYSKHSGNHPNPAGAYEVKAIAEGGVTTDELWMHTFVDAHNISDAASAGYASASITFRPMVDTISLTQTGIVTLTDLTDNLDLVVNSGWLENEYLVSLNQFHIYEIKIKPIGTWYRGDHYLSIKSVPEPSSVLILGMLLAGLGLRRRK